MLIHHSSYPLAIWFVSNYFPGGHMTFAGFINAFTHMILFAFRLIFVNLFPNTRLYHYRRSIGLWLFVSFHHKFLKIKILSYNFFTSFTAIPVWSHFCACSPASHLEWLQLSYSLCILYSHICLINHCTPCCYGRATVVVIEFIFIFIKLF